MHKNIIFDLGNVLYDYNRRNIVSKFINEKVSNYTPLIKIPQVRVLTRKNFKRIFR